MRPEPRPTLFAVSAALLTLGCPDTSCPPGSHDEGGRCIADTDAAVFDGGRPDAPRPDARPSLDAPPDTRLGPCPSVLDRLPTCTDAPSTSYCDDLTRSVIDVPDALFEQLLLGGPEYPSRRVGILPDVPVVLDLPGEEALSAMSSDLVGGDLYFGFFGTTGGYLGRAEFVDSLGPVDVVEIVSGGFSSYPSLVIRGAQAMVADGRDVWGPVAIPATGALGAPPRTTDLDASVGFSGETPVVMSGVAVVEPAGVPPFAVAGPLTFWATEQLVYTSGGESNAGIWLRQPELGQVDLGAAQIRATVSESAGTENV